MTFFFYSELNATSQVDVGDGVNGALEVVGYVPEVCDGVCCAIANSAKMEMRRCSVVRTRTSVFVL